jgi:hypothetical protein
MITTRGPGADAVLMQDGGSLFNAGTIANTTPGGTAIGFCSCSTGYKLTIAPTSVITGLVTATGNDTFQLGGTGNGSFDLNSIGPTKQYEGFGVFNVVSGFWTVSKVFGQSDAWNVNGGTLAGTGTLADLNVNAGGTLQPGTTPGTAMKITGNLAFQSGALYVVTLNGTASTLAKVSGTASLAGDVQALLQPGVTKQTYTILHSGGLGGTTFDSLTVAPGFTGKLTYTPTDVLLGLNANLGGAGSGGGLNINQQNVANALNNFFNAGGALPAGFLPVFNLTGANLQNALTQLSGEANVDGQAVTFQQMTQARARLVSRPSRKPISHPTSRSPTTPSLRRRRRNPRHWISAGPRGARPTAAATRPMAIPSSVRTHSRRILLASPPAWTITRRPTQSSALRLPAAAPIGRSRKRSAAGGATRSRPASMAPNISGRPTSPVRSPSPTTG